MRHGSEQIFLMKYTADVPTLASAATKNSHKIGVLCKRTSTAYNRTKKTHEVLAGQHRQHQYVVVDPAGPPKMSRFRFGPIRSTSTGPLQLNTSDKYAPVEPQTRVSLEKDL